MKGLFQVLWLLFLASWLLPANAATLEGKLPWFGWNNVFISTSDNQAGAYIPVTRSGRSSNTFTVELDANQDYYLHIYRWGLRAFVGEFTLSGSTHEFSNGSTQILTNTENWLASTSGWENYQGVSDASDRLWLENYRGDIDPNAKWIWPPGDWTAIYEAYFTIPIKRRSSTLEGKLNVDDQYEVYISSSDDLQGTLISSGNNWRNTGSFSHELMLGQDYYLHVYARNTGYQAGFLGEFSIEGAGHWFSNGTQKLLTNTTDWLASASGWRDYEEVTSYGNNGVSPWGLRGAVDPDAQWIWLDPSRKPSSPPPRFPPNPTVYFTAKIYGTEPVQDSECATVLGNGIQTINPSGVMTFEKKDSRLLNVNSELRFNFPNKANYKDSLHCYGGDPDNGGDAGAAKECLLADSWQTHKANIEFKPCTGCNSYYSIGSSSLYTLPDRQEYGSLTINANTQAALPKPDEYYINALNLHSNSVLYIPGGSDVYVNNDLEINGEIAVTGSGTVRLFVNGSLTLNSNSNGINPSGTPDQMVVLVSGSVTLRNNTAINGSIIQDDGSDAQQQSFTIGNNTKVRGLISADGGFNLGKSDVTIDLRALNADFRGVCTQSAVETTYTIDVTQTQALTCEAINATLEVKEDGVIATNYEGSVTLSSSSGVGEWIAPAGSESQLSATSNGTATYTFSSEDQGLVVLQFRHAASGSTVLSMARSDGAITASSPAIEFRLKGFDVSFSPEYPVANTPFDLIVQAVAAEPDNPQVCNPVVDYTGNKSLELNMVYSDYNRSANESLTFKDVPVPPVGQTGLTQLFSFEGKNDEKGVATATKALNFADVGEIAVHVNDPTSAVEESGVGSVTIVPYQVLVADVRHCDGESNPKNPAGTATFGNGFVAAGESFSAIVVATIANCSGSANACSGTVTCTAPSFVEPVTLSADLDTPSGGHLGAFSSSTQAYANGAAVTELTYSEVGSMKLKAELNNFLGTGVHYSDSAEVGRFYPDYLELAEPLLTPACASGATSFSYLGDDSQHLFYSVKAKNRSGNIVENYDSGWGYSYLASPVYHLIDGALGSFKDAGETHSLSRLVLNSGPDLTWTKGVTTVDSNFMVSKGGTKEGPYEQTHLGLELKGDDNETFKAFDYTCAQDGNCHAVELGQLAPLRYGRLAIANGYGPINQSLHIPLSWEYWNGSGFVTNTDDSCSDIALNRLQFNDSNGSNAPFFNIPVGSSGATGVSLTVDLATYLSSTSQYSIPLTSNAGRAWIRYSAPGDSGYVTHNVLFTKPEINGWLKYDWDGDGTEDTEATGIASFGSIRGSDRVISRKELSTFTPHHFHQ